MSKSDFVGDEALPFLFLLKEASALPDYVQQVPEAKDLQHLPSVAFADSDNRLFPIHDKQATYLSAVTAFVNGVTKDEDPWVENLKIACKAHGIETDVLRAHEVLEVKIDGGSDVSEKVASAKPDRVTHALELVITPGEAPTKYYPIGSGTEVEMTAMKIAEDISEKKLPTAWHSEACEKLLKAASDFGVDAATLPKVVVSYGRRFIPSRSVLESEIEARKNAGVSEEFLEIYKSAAEGALAGTLSPNDGALVWQAADKKAGIEQKFSKDNDPLWAFKSGMPEEEFEKIKNAHVLLGEVLIPKAKLDALDDTVVVGSLNREDAVKYLMAKSASSGVEASGTLATLSESSTRWLSQMILTAEEAK